MSHLSLESQLILRWVRVSLKLTLTSHVLSPRDKVKSGLKFLRDKHVQVKLHIANWKGSHQIIHNFIVIKMQINHKSAICFNIRNGKTLMTLQSVVVVGNSFCRFLVCIEKLSATRSLYHFDLG